MTDTTAASGHDDRYKVLTPICISAVIIPLVFTGPAISTPAVGRDLGGDQASLSWIVNAYAIAFGGCVMAAGALGDHIGRKRCFVSGLVLFTITSVLIGFTPNLLALNLLRAVEGIGGAFVLTSATSLLAQEFEGDERTRAFSLLGTAFGAGLAFGPIASGFLIETLGWRSPYFAIALISILILAFGTPRIRESRNPDAKGIDWSGTILFTAGTGAAYLWDRPGTTGRVGQRSRRCALHRLGAAAHRLRDCGTTERPTDAGPVAVPLSPVYRVQILPVATGFSFIALIVYLPTWFIAVQARDEFAAGLAILPLTAPMLVVPLLAGRLARRLSPGILSGVGFLISAGGALLLLGMSPGTSVWPMVLPMLLISIGNGIPWGLMDALSVSVVPKERAGMAAGIFTTMRVAGEAIAIAAIGAALIGFTVGRLSVRSTEQTITLPETAAVLANGIGSGATVNLGASVSALVYESYTDAFHAVLIVLAVLAALAAMVCFLTLRTSTAKRPT